MALHIRAIVFIAAVLFLAKTKAQQYQLAAGPLTEDFSAMYLKTKKEGTIFERLMDASKWFFSTGNKPFIEKVYEVKKQFNIATDSSILMIFDTVLNRFIKDYLWETRLSDFKKNEEILGYYNKKVCPCVTEKITSAPFGSPDEKDMNDCLARLVADTGYINTMRRMAGTRTINEMYEVSQLAFLYSLRNCTVSGKYFMDAIKENSAYLCIAQINYFGRNADREVLAMYKAKEYGKLSVVFPAYRQFESHLKQVIKLTETGMMYSYREQKLTPAGILECTNTYYKQRDKKIYLLGQVIYTVSQEAAGTQVLSMEFLQPAKITKQAALLKSISADLDVEPPPPPGIEIIKDVRIDTTRHNNL